MYNACFIANFLDSVSVTAFILTRTVLLENNTNMNLAQQW